MDRRTFVSAIVAAGESTRCVGPNDRFGAMREQFLARWLCWSSRCLPSGGTSQQFVILHRRLLAIVRDDEVCGRLMTTPGVGPVVALTYRVTVDVPARFRKSKSVGAVFGLTCSKYQSGEMDRSGRISRCGDEICVSASKRLCSSVLADHGSCVVQPTWLSISLINCPILPAAASACSR
jgi:Transposase IS116/IS110/IS902 family